MSQNRIKKFHPFFLEIKAPPFLATLLGFTKGSLTSAAAAAAVADTEAGPQL